MPWTEQKTFTISNPIETDISPGNTHIAAGGTLGAFTVWEFASGTSVFSATGYDACNSVRFSPGGGLVSYTTDTVGNHIRHVDTATWTEYANAAFETGSVYGQFDYSADGSHLAHYTSDSVEVRTVSGDVSWPIAYTFPISTSTKRGLGWNTAHGYILATDRLGNYWVIDTDTWTQTDSGTITNAPDIYQVNDHPIEPWFVLSDGSAAGNVTVVEISDTGQLTELIQFAEGTDTEAACLSAGYLYTSLRTVGNDIVRVADGRTWPQETTIPLLTDVLRARFSRDGHWLSIGDRTGNAVRVYDAPHAFSLSASAAGSGSATGTRTRPLDPRPTATTDLDIDAEGPIHEWHLLDDFSETTALDPYTGQKASYSLDPTNPVIVGTNVLLSGADDVGITHTEWTLRYGSRYRFWMDPAGNFSGLYIGSTQGGLSTGEMEGVGVGADPTFGSLDIVNISTGTWDYDQFVDAPISSGNWYQFEVVIEDPATTNPQIILRLLDDKGQTVAAEVTRPTTGFTGVAEPVIGVAADTAGARFDKFQTDDFTTFPGHWIEIHANASGSLSAAPEKSRSVSQSPSATGTASASVTKGRTLAITGDGTGDGAIGLQRGTARALIFGASAAGSGDVALTKTTTRSFTGTGTATANVPLDKERTTTYAGVGSATGTLATTRQRYSSLAGGASGTLTAPLDRAVTFALAGSATGVAHGWLLRGESANVISTRTLIGRVIDSTPRQIGEFTRATPRLSGTAVEETPQLKGRAVEETPELKGRAVREHPTIVGTLIRD